jgi:hypothetical protein
VKDGKQKKASKMVHMPVKQEVVAVEKEFPQTEQVGQ